MASVSKAAMTTVLGEDTALKAEIFASIERLAAWLEKNDYKAYDTFDGLSSKIARPFTFHNKILEIVLQQGVRRFPLNLRPILGIPRSKSTKGMGFLARGFMRMHDATGDSAWAEKARFALDWLIAHKSPGYSGACWGNHFDYQCRSFYLPKGVPTVVWTSLIGHAFLDGYEHFNDKQYLETAISACEHVVRDLERFPDGDTHCITYVPGLKNLVHNANTLGASLLARTFSFTRTDGYRDIAQKAIAYAAKYQRSDSSWWYGEKENLRWVDNFHTAYVLDCFKHYSEGTGDTTFDTTCNKGYEYWKKTFFLADGTPRYYDYKTLPIDIQCCSQAIDTLVYFNDRDASSLELAEKVARWTIKNMQDPSGYFYYRRYSSWLVNKTPTLHWGQATMLCALAALHKAGK